MNANQISQAAADDLFRASEYIDDLDDYSCDDELGHCYHLSDGRTVVVTGDGLHVLDGADESDDDEADDGEGCPGCGCRPGDGWTDGCEDCAATRAILDPEDGDGGRWGINL